MLGIRRPMEVFILMRNCISFCVVKVMCVLTQNNIAIWAQYKCDCVNAPDISVLGLNTELLACGDGLCHYII